MSILSITLSKFLQFQGYIFFFCIHLTFLLHYTIRTWPIPLSFALVREALKKLILTIVGWISLFTSKNLFFPWWYFASSHLHQNCQHSSFPWPFLFKWYTTLPLEPFFFFLHSWYEFLCFAWIERIHHFIIFLLFSFLVLILCRIHLFEWRILDLWVCCFGH